MTKVRKKGTDDEFLPMQTFLKDIKVNNEKIRKQLIADREKLLAIKPLPKHEKNRLYTYPAWGLARVRKIKPVPKKGYWPGDHLKEQAGFTIKNLACFNRWVGCRDEFKYVSRFGYNLDVKGIPAVDTIGAPAVSTVAKEGELLSKYVEKEVFDRSFVEGFLPTEGEGDFYPTDVYPEVPSLMHQEVINYWDKRGYDVIF